MGGFLGGGESGASGTSVTTYDYPGKRLLTDILQYLSAGFKRGAAPYRGPLPGTGGPTALQRRAMDRPTAQRETEALDLLRGFATGSLTEGMRTGVTREYEARRETLGEDVAQALEQHGLYGTRRSTGAREDIGDVLGDFYRDYLGELSDVEQAGAQLQYGAGLALPEALSRRTQQMFEMGTREWEQKQMGRATRYEDWLRRKQYPLTLTSLIGTLGQLRSQPSAVRTVSQSQAETGGGCCFIFIEAQRGLDPVVRAYRDKKMNVRNRRGYYRMADWLVPLMRKSRVVMEVVRWAMVRPCVAYGRAWMGYNHVGKIFAPLVGMWRVVWAILGTRSPYIRRGTKEVI